MSTHTSYFGSRPLPSRTPGGLARRALGAVSTAIKHALPVVATLAIFAACMLAIIAVRFVVWAPHFNQ